MKKREGKKSFKKNVIEKEAVCLPKCSFSWEKLIEMKDKNVEFFAGDGYKRLRIIDIDEKTKSIHMICELGKITWPLKYEKLEKLHKIFHNEKITLLPYRVDKLIPTWGNYIAGLLKYLGCDKV